MTNFDGKPGGGPGGSDLPDIDPDPEVAAGLQQLDGGNREIVIFYQLYINELTLETTLIVYWNII